MNILPPQHNLFPRGKSVQGRWNDLKKDVHEEWRDIQKKSGGKIGRIGDISVNLHGYSLNVNVNDIEKRAKQIRRYEKTFRRTRSTQRLNERINRLLPSASTLIAFYKAQPRFKEYITMESMKKIKYIIYSHDNQKIQNPAEILAYQKDNLVDNDILWKCSNQSIIADFITALTSPTSLIRPQLGAEIVVSNLLCKINFNRDDHNYIAPYVHTECFLNVTIPDDNNHEGDRHCLAGIHISVYFCPDHQVFEGRVINIFPFPLLTESQVNRAAEYLAASRSLSDQFSEE